MLVRHACRMATAARSGGVPAAALTKLAATGALFGPACVSYDRRDQRRRCRRRRPHPHPPPPPRPQDAIHNQDLLQYDLLPIALELPTGVAKTALIIPPLLALTYALLGGIFPAIAQAVVGDGQARRPLLLGGSARSRAAAAVFSTSLVIKSSSLLLGAEATTGLPPSVALGLLAGLALLQWLVLDAR